MAVVFSTSAVPPGERLAYWHDAVWKTFVPLDVTSPKDAPFSGSVATDRLGQLQVSTVNADQTLVRRSQRLISASRDEYILLGLQTGGAGVVVQDSRTATLLPGQCALYDTTRPYTLDFSVSDRFEMVVFQMPRRVLRIPESDLQQITGITIDSDQGLGAVTVPFLSRLATEASTYGPEVSEMLARNVADLLTTVITERLGRDVGRTDAAERTLVLRIRAFIDAHLTDPALSIDAIAAAHHISPRHLQRLFHAEDATVGAWIRQRRLEECRRELSRPRRTRPTVAAVGHRWGFVSPAHFSRAFRSAFGMSPRQWQAVVDQNGGDDPR